MDVSRILHLYHVILTSDLAERIVVGGVLLLVLGVFSLSCFSFELFCIRMCVLSFRFAVFDGHISEEHIAVG